MTANTNTYYNEFRVTGGHGAKVEAALTALQVPEVTRTEDAEAGDLIRVRVPVGVDSLDHWRALRDLRDAIVATAQAEAVAEAHRASMAHGMSATAVHLAAASAALDEARREAHAAEGTPAEPSADARFAEAERLYREAAAAHREARRAHNDNI